MTAPMPPTTAVAVPDAAGFSGFGKKDDLLKIRKSIHSKILVLPFEAEL